MQENILTDLTNLKKGIDEVSKLFTCVRTVEDDIIESVKALVVFDLNEVDFKAQSDYLLDKLDELIEIRDELIISIENLKDI